MCVIVVVDDKLNIPSLETLKKCEDANKDGGGVSWEEGGKIHWKKGIDYKEIHEIIKEKGVPAVAHFRIGTVGSKEKGLTHPFPITAKCETSLEGSADRVLFHNGHWNDWDKVCMNIVLFKNVYFPGGDWSDSRAMAWVLNHSNVSFLRFLSQKVVLHTTKGLHYFGAFEKKDGVYYSNLNWNNSYKQTTYLGGFHGPCDKDWEWDEKRKYLKYVGKGKSETEYERIKRLEDEVNSYSCGD